MAGDDFNYEDVTVYTLDNEDEERMLKLQTECTFIWANKEGWPVGVIMSYVWAKGCFWVTLTSQRARVPAMRRDNRCAVCVTSKGSKAGFNQTVTYKGLCEILDDDETKAWFYPALAEALNPADEQWQKRLESRFLRVLLFNVGVAPRRSLRRCAGEEHLQLQP